MNFLILKIVSKYTYFDRDALTVGVKLYRLENLSKQKQKPTQPSPPKKEKYTNKQQKNPKNHQKKTSQTNKNNSGFFHNWKKIISYQKYTLYD